MLPGLPTELAESAVLGLLRAARLPPGTLVVDRAGFDPVETSLAKVLSRDRDLGERAVLEQFVQSRP